MNTVDCFEDRAVFESALTILRSDVYIVSVPAGIESLDSLFSAYSRLLRLPNYFGGNWNAFSDCLRDLHWIDSRDVLIVHSDMPRLDREDLFQYLDVLAEACSSWRPGEEHRLRVFFPAGDLPIIGRVLAR